MPQLILTVRAALARATLTLGLLVFALGAARADGLTDALAKFSSGGFAGPISAVRSLAASSDPRAMKALDALRADRLYLDSTSGAVFIKKPDGALVDAATGAARADASGLHHIAVTNPIRRVLDAVAGQEGLTNSDPAARIKAADQVYVAHDLRAHAALRKAVAQEKDPAAKAALERALASVALYDPASTMAERTAAISTLRGIGDERARALLAAAVDGLPANLQKEAHAAVSAIDFRLSLWQGVQNVWYGLSLGSVLLLAAIGLAITFGVMGIINMAHGEMVMLGAYCTYAVQVFLRAYAPGLMDVSLLIAVPLAFLVTGAIGILIERSIIRFLYGRPLETLLATFGLSLILQQAVRVLFGADNRDVVTPFYMAGSFNLFGLSITTGRMWIIAFALVVFAVLQLVLRATPFGLRMRAVTQNRRMASAMGIDTNRIDALAFGLGSGIAGMAGVALSQIDNVSPNLGQSYIIDSFLVVVFGGVGNLWGTFVAAATLGVANKLLEPFAGAVLGKIALLVFIILFIQKRPRGLFALKGRAVEA